MAESEARFDGMLVEVAVVDVETFREGVLDLAKCEAYELRGSRVVGLCFLDRVWEMARR